MHSLTVIGECSAQHWSWVRALLDPGSGCLERQSDWTTSACLWRQSAIAYVYTSTWQDNWKRLHTQSSRAADCTCTCTVYNNNNNGKLALPTSAEPKALTKTMLHKRKQSIRVWVHIYWVTLRAFILRNSTTATIPRMRTKSRVSCMRLAVHVEDPQRVEKKKSHEEN